LYIRKSAPLLAAVEQGESDGSHDQNTGNDGEEDGEVAVLGLYVDLLSRSGTAALASRAASPRASPPVWSWPDDGTSPSLPCSTPWLRRSPWPKPSDAGELVQPGAVRTTLDAAVGGAHRPRQPARGLEHTATYHPTFLYEPLWNLPVIGVILFVERRRWLRPGRLFAAYVAAYAPGLFWIERLRIAHDGEVDG
jgi:Prolipoprotein diacylglyceryl transferase